MKVLTFQHKSIVLDLVKQGYYTPTRISEFHNDTPKCYKLLFDSIKVKEAGTSNCIFGWCVVIDSDNSNLTPCPKTVHRCMGMTGQEPEDYFIFELEIDKNRLSLQNFYAFVNARCEEMRYDPYYDCFEDFPFEQVFKYDENDEVQCVFTSIKVEDIRGIYSYSTCDNKTYNIKQLV